MRLFLVIFAVEALAASWIEIAGEGSNKMDEASKPLRLRGLKLFTRLSTLLWTRSKPLRLRGLKSRIRHVNTANGYVEALAASWIEIAWNEDTYIELLESKPLRLRGLKYTCTGRCISENRSKPLRLRGLKYLSLDCKFDVCIVEALAASWIEMRTHLLCLLIMLSKPLRLRGLKLSFGYYLCQKSGRSPCGFVD